MLDGEVNDVVNGSAGDGGGGAGTPPSSTPAAGAGAAGASGATNPGAAPAAGAQPPAAGAGGAPGAPVVPAQWVANYKYKVDGQEKEFDEQIRAFIKDEASEKLMRDLVTARDALPGIKSSREAFEREVGQLKPVMEQTISRVRELGEAYKAGQKSGDMSGYAAAVGLTDEMIFALAKQKLEFQDLPPEQREAILRNQERERQIADRERNLRSGEARVLQESAQTRSFRLDTELGKAGVKAVADTFEEIYGSGSFKQAVIEAGQQAWQLNKKDLSVAEAISAVEARFKPVMEKLKGAGAPAAAQTPPVIPHVAGRSAAPTKVQHKSLDDLKKLADAMPD